ncbi:ATP-binding cassette domain-containing protein [Microbacteriaceae bacterium VKM Ac-2855]|nr:ATP-binding cassette domain-containing protein [Microbacteriaceae bacterium VKM Ac-2855]
MTESVLSLRGINRRYENAAHPALANVDLTIAQGEFVALVGPSGAGKSTLLNILGLLDTADSGEYLLGGVLVGSLSERDRDELRARTFGFVFQDAFVQPNETVGRNTALPLRMRGESIAAQSRAVASALSGFGLLELVDQAAGTLSGGERQRLALARAVSARPSIVLADEPTGSLDSENSGIVMDALVELNRSGVTVIVITHSEEVAARAHRRIRVDDGRVHAEHAPAAAASSSAPQKRSRLRRRWHIPDALTALLASPVRTLGILAAFVIAIAGLVTSVNSSATAATQISQRLSEAALDSITVLMPDAAAADELVSAEAHVGALTGVEAAGIRIGLTASAARTSRVFGAHLLTSDAPVFVVDAGFLDAERVTTRPVVTPVASAGTPTAILGTSAATELGLASSRIGDIITISDQNVIVAGYVHATPRDPGLAEAVLVSLDGFELPPNTDNRIVVRTRPGQPAAVADSIPLAVDPGHPEATKVQTVADLRSLSRGVNDDLARGVLLIAAVLLVLVCFTSGLSMFLTITARTREIALRRAVGATRGDIRALFLIEGTVIGCAGGIAGLAVGTLATTIVSGAQGWAPVFDPAGACAGVVAGILAGAVSAVVPAFRAARIDPALALRAA